MAGNSSSQPKTDKKADSKPKKTPGTPSPLEVLAGSKGLGDSIPPLMKSMRGTKSREDEALTGRPLTAPKKEGVWAPAPSGHTEDPDIKFLLDRRMFHNPKPEQKKKKEERTEADQPR